MKNLLFRLSFTAFSMVCMVAVGLGQIEDRDAAAAASGNLYVVSAKAGGTSYVEGSVTIKRAEGRTGQLLQGDFVKEGDLVTTGDTGRAEILMNPGSFLRMDRNSTFHFGSTALEALKVNIGLGSAIFEVFASDDFMVNVTAGSSSFSLVKTGIYRVDVDAEGNARLEVWEGKANTGVADVTEIKKGRAADIAGDSVAVSKFNKSKDEFEKWSEERAKLIAKANARLEYQALERGVLSSFRDYGWNCYDSIGLWVFDRQLRSFGFLPFGLGWRSPYGHRLRTSTTTCYYPEEYWRRPMIALANPPVSGGGSAPVVPQENIDRARRLRTPPFQRMEQSGSVRRVQPEVFPSSDGFPSGGSSGGNGSSGSSSSSSNSNSTTKTQSDPSPPPVSAPQRRAKDDN